MPFCFLSAGLSVCIRCVLGHVLGSQEHDELDSFVLLLRGWLRVPMCVIWCWLVGGIRWLEAVGLAWLNVDPG